MRIFTREALQYISDNEVERSYRNIQDKINDTRRSKRKGPEAKEAKFLLEIEACYVYREIERRRSRKAAHAKYILGLS